MILTGMGPVGALNSGGKVIPAYALFFGLVIGATEFCSPQFSAVLTSSTSGAPTLSQSGKSNFDSTTRLCRFTFRHGRINSTILPLGTGADCPGYEWKNGVAGRPENASALLESSCAITVVRGLLSARGWRCGRVTTRPGSHGQHQLNDVANYPQDSRLRRARWQDVFSYLYDESQRVAKAIAQHRTGHLFIR
jgi:hypothetical protein